MLQRPGNVSQYVNAMAQEGTVGILYGRGALVLQCRQVVLWWCLWLVRLHLLVLM